MLLQQQQNIEPQASTATHCPYCAFQCGMQISRTGQEISIAGDAAFPVNKGALCIKGWTAAATLAHPDRLTTPLARDANGALAPVSWDEAMERIVRGIEAAQSAYGKDSVGIFGGRVADQRKELPAGQICAGSTANRQHRLQRAILHVIGGGGEHPGAGH